MHSLVVVDGLITVQRQSFAVDEQSPARHQKRLRTIANTTTTRRTIPAMTIFKVSAFLSNYHYLSARPLSVCGRSLCFGFTLTGSRGAAVGVA